ncbi:MAG: 1-deoxy-D-xylulose-5-phosphate reductoisomerase, partial [Bacilli bacterium]|nr:1-deoxy-D-xylulose-5-phosphate reductoisomerase [Bacilli bacterium]
ALKMGGTATAVINAANEVAIALFLEGKIRFSDIVKVNEMTLSHFTNIMNPTLTTLVSVDKEVRQYVRTTFEKGVN